MRKFLYVFFFLCSSLLVFPAMASQVTPVKKNTFKTDSGHVNTRTFDTQKLNAYKEQQAFNYTDEVPESTWWTRFWSWFWKGVDSIFRSRFTGTLIKYIAIGLIIGLVVYAVMKAIGLNIWVIAGKAKPVEVPFSETLDNIHEIDFNEEIGKAIANTNYRLAVRLCYLLSLKKLNDRNLISWQPEKTNETYIDEIKDPDQQQQFSQLTRQFEYVWYGEFYIDKENFGQLKQSFDQFNQDKS